jgi:hypothetical protein
MSRDWEKYYLHSDMGGDNLDFRFRPPDLSTDVIFTLAHITVHSTYPIMPPKYFRMLLTLKTRLLPVPPFIMQHQA